jgi:5-methyltetrahydrofolate--homocysteine methyltransferase
LDNERGKIKRLLKHRILILDGASGTELQHRGMPAGVCPESWCLENPGIILDIHAGYANAGSDIIYTSTFGANRLKLNQYNLDHAYEINRDLVHLARQAVGKNTLLAGDIGSTGHLVEPFGDLPFEEAVGVFKEQIKGLLEGGVDLFVIETMTDIQEARAALLAVREITDKFVMVTLTFEQSGQTLSGTDPVTALITLQSLGANAVGCNCSTGPEAMIPHIAAMKPFATVPLVAKPNAGMPRLIGKKTVFDMDARTFGKFGLSFAEAGVNLLGGCCGTTPEYISEVKKHLAGFKPALPVRKSISAVASARRYRILDPKAPTLIVGERINPTGKKDLQAELLAGKTGLVRKMAREQESFGADLLDVNVGVPGIDEVSTIRKVIGVLSTATGLPLSIDSSKVETIEAALRLYPGRAIINSISGEKGKKDCLLPMAAKYGAMFILLPIMEGEIPETCLRRQAIVRETFREAQHHGFTKEDIVVDGLVMTVASNPETAMETIRTVAWCTDQFHCRTILGLSNVSFGLPERRWLNGAFISMAQASGLTMAIANPASQELMALKRAGDVLTRKDRNASVYIAHFSQRPPSFGEMVSIENETPEGKVAQAIMDGNREDVLDLVDKAITAGTAASSLVDETMIPTIIQVGELFDRKVYFLPHLIASAETMKKAMGHLESRLQSDSMRKERGLILMATVEGDIHDIGKNIVVLMLKNHSFHVIDLGKDVSTEVIVDAAREVRPDLIGLSALMTSTMTNMEKIIIRVKETGLSCRFIVGGAVVTEEYARSIGAAYAKDGVEAVRVAETLINQVKLHGKL